MAARAPSRVLVSNVGPSPVAERGGLIRVLARRPARSMGSTVGQLEHQVYGLNLRAIAPNPARRDGIDPFGRPQEALGRESTIAPSSTMG